MGAESAQNAGRSGHGGLVGTAIAAYALLDAYIMLRTVVVLSAWLNPLFVFIGAAVLFTVINVFCCTWLNTHWDGWIEGHKPIGRKLEKMRAR
jgi:hypothetical protein